MNIHWKDWCWSWNWCEEPTLSLRLGKTEGRRRRGRQRVRWLDGITDAMEMSLSKLWGLWCTGRPGMLQSMGSQVLDMTEQLNWTDSKSGLVWCISVFRIVRTHLYIVCMFLPLLMTFMTHYLNRTHLLLKDNFILKFCAT